MLVITCIGAVTPADITNMQARWTVALSAFSAASIRQIATNTPGRRHAPFFADQGPHSGAQSHGPVAFESISPCGTTAIFDDLESALIWLSSQLG